MLGLVIDESNSNRNVSFYNQALSEAADLAEEVVRNPNSSFIVAFVDTEVKFSTRTRDVAGLRRVLTQIRPGGGTAIYDGIAGLAERIRSDPGSATSRGVLVVLSDGGDNQSRTNRQEVIRKLQETGVVAYCIWINPSQLESESGEALKKIAEESGGIRFEAMDNGRARKALQSIGHAIANEYRVTLAFANAPSTATTPQIKCLRKGVHLVALQQATPSSDLR